MFLDFLIKEKGYEHINVKTFKITNRSTTRSSASPTTLLLEYLQYIASGKMESPRVIDVTTVKSRRLNTYQNSNKIFIQDPYIPERNLGRYLTEKNLNMLKSASLMLLKFLMRGHWVSQKTIETFRNNLKDTATKEQSSKEKGRPGLIQVG